MMKRFCIFTLILSMLSLAACGSGAYTSKAFGFSAVCPEGWIVSEDAFSVCFGTPESYEGDDFFENVLYEGAVSLSVTEAGTLDAYVDQLTALMAENSTDYTELSRESAVIADMDAIVLTYTFTSSQTAYVIKQRMFILSDGENIHNIVYSANSETFDLYADAAASIAESFKLK